MPPALLGNDPGVPTKEMGERTSGMGLPPECRKKEGRVIQVMCELGLLTGGSCDPVGNCREHLVVAPSQGRDTVFQFQRTLGGAAL